MLIFNHVVKYTMKNKNKNVHIFALIAPYNGKGKKSFDLIFISIIKKISVWIYIRDSIFYLFVTKEKDKKLLISK